MKRQTYTHAERENITYAVIYAFIYLCMQFFKSLLLFIISEIGNQFAFTLQNLSKSNFIVCLF